MEKHNVSNKRTYLGLFLIALGSLWILERLNLIPESWNNVLISWQMLLIGIGVFSLIGGNKTTGAILIVIGGFFIIPELAYIPDELRRIGWPLLIIGVGVVLLLTHSRKKPVQPQNFESSTSGLDYFDDFVIFGGREVIVNSQSFYGGKTTSIFGGAEYDMRQTKLSPNGAVVDCVCIFGGGGFKIPPDWTVKNEVVAIFGAFSDKRGGSVNHVHIDPSKTLIIKGFAAFGGIEIKHF